MDPKPLRGEVPLPSLPGSPEMDLLDIPSPSSPSPSTLPIPDALTREDLINLVKDLISSRTQDKARFAVEMDRAGSLAVHRERKHREVLDRAAQRLQETGRRMDRMTFEREELVARVRKAEGALSTVEGLKQQVAKTMVQRDTQTINLARAMDRLKEMQTRMAALEGEVQELRKQRREGTEHSPERTLRGGLPPSPELSATDIHLDSATDTVRTRSRSRDSAPSGSSPCSLKGLGHAPRNVPLYRNSLDDDWELGTTERELLQARQKVAKWVSGQIVGKDSHFF